MSTWINPTSASSSLATGFGTGSSGQILTSNGSTASWVAPATSGTVTSVATSNSATALTLSGGPITSSGTLALSYSGTALPILNGGTGQTTASASFNALSPMTTGGDLIYGGASGAGTRLANGTAGQRLQSNGTTLAPTWVNANAGTVTSVDTSNSATALTLSGGPITSSGTLALSYSGTALPILNGGTASTTQAAAQAVMNPFGSTNYGAIQYGGVTTTPALLGSGAAVGLTLATGGGSYNPAWTYGGCGNTGTFTPTLGGSGATYTGGTGSYSRIVCNLNTTLGAYVNTTTVNIQTVVHVYPTGFGTGTGFGFTLPFAAYGTQTQYVTGFVMSTGTGPQVGMYLAAIPPGGTTAVISAAGIRLLALTGPGWTTSADDVFILNCVYQSV